MSVVIQISYQEADELDVILNRLEDLPLTVSTKDYESGKFKRCYLRCKRKLTEPEGTEYPGA